LEVIPLDLAVLACRGEGVTGLSAARGDGFTTTGVARDSCCAVEPARRGDGSVGAEGAAAAAAEVREAAEAREAAVAAEAAEARAAAASCSPAIAPAIDVGRYSSSRDCCS
jgi:hypothetical protein